MDFHGFPSRSLEDGKSQPAAPTKTFARFQAGFLSSEDVHRFLSTVGGLVGFACSSMGFPGFPSMSL